MHIENVFSAVKTDLDALANVVRDEHRAVQAAGAALLHHAMAAGDALFAAQQAVSGPWKRWLRDNCFLGVRTAFIYQRLARHRGVIEAEVERHGHLSLRAALRLIGTSRSAAPQQQAIASPLKVSAWNNATPDQRRQFLNEIGLCEILGAMPDAWRAEIERRVEGQHTAAASPLSRKVTKALREALSRQRSAKHKDSASHSVASALNGINNLLAGADCDLNDVEIAVKAAMKHAA